MTISCDFAKNTDLTAIYRLLIISATPENPVLTIDHKHPFVNDNITFTCTATVQRWPRYIPSNISYQFFGIPRGYINNNTLILNKLTKSDKDIAISCQATDDLGKVSNMSQSIILDPYCKYNLVKPYLIKICSVIDICFLPMLHTWFILYSAFTSFFILESLMSLVTGRLAYTVLTLVSMMSIHG